MVISGARPSLSRGRKSGSQSLMLASRASVPRSISASAVAATSGFVSDAKRKIVSSCMLAPGFPVGQPGGPPVDGLAVPPHQENAADDPIGRDRLVHHPVEPGLPISHVSLFRLSVCGGT